MRYTFVMTLSDYLKQYKIPISALAKEIGAYQPDVSRWVSGKRPVPVRRCVPIEKATNGHVTRKDLRPDDWHMIWPDLDAREVKAA